MDRKFFDITIFLLVGILTGYYLRNSLLKLSILVALVLIMILLIDLKNGEKRLLVTSLFIFLGIFMVFNNFKSSRLLKLSGKEVVINGVVEEINRDKDKVKLVIKVREINKKKIKKEKILVTYRGRKDFMLGDKLIIKSKLNLANENTNPKLFNYREYLRSRGIHTTSQIKDKNILAREASNKLGYSLRTGFKNRVNKSLDHGFNPRNKNLLKSIILAENYLVEEDIGKYRSLGLAHILAASGLHIGIIVLSLEFFFSLFKVHKKVSRLGILILVWTYGFLINFPISIVRANIMLTIYYLSINFYLPYDYKNTIFFTMFILLISNPFLIFNISFILSFGAVLSLAYISPPIEAYLLAYNNKLARLVAPIVGVTLGLLPITIYYFNEVQVLGLLANLLIVPLISMALNLIVLVIVFGNNLLFLKLLLNLVLDFKFFLVDLLGKINKNVLMFSPEAEEIVIFYIIVFLLLYFYNYRKLIKDNFKFLLIISTLYGGLFIYNTRFREVLNINFIDVGQGDFAHINYKGKNYIIDTGGEVFGDFSIGKNISLPYLVKHNIFKLDGVFISHFHEDHSKALEDILEEVETKYIFVSYLPEENPIYKRAASKNNIRLIQAGSKVNLDKNLKFYVISPDRKYEDENNMSMVGILKYKNFKALFTGDMEREVERNLLGKNIGKMDLIKVPHHGSKTSSTKEFLEKIRPKLGVISVGRNNRFNHPNTEVLDAYRDINTRILKTSDEGFINISLGKNLKIYRYLHRKGIGFGEIFYYFIMGILLVIYIDKDLSTRNYLT